MQILSIYIHDIEQKSNFDGMTERMTEGENDRENDRMTDRTNPV